MKSEAFEMLLGVNKGFEQSITSLEEMESVEPFSKATVEKFRLEAERLQAGINRYVAEVLHRDADNEAARLDKVLAPEEASEADKG